MFNLSVFLNFSPRGEETGKPWGLSDIVYKVGHIKSLNLEKIHKVAQRLGHHLLLNSEQSDSLYFLTKSASQKVLAEALSSSAENPKANRTTISIPSSELIGGVVGFMMERTHGYTLDVDVTPVALSHKQSREIQNLKRKIRMKEVPSTALPFSPVSSSTEKAPTFDP